MNLLAGINRTRRECGVSGVDFLTVETGLSDEGKRFVDWYNQAWQDVQTAQAEWQWMRKGFTFNTVASQQTYTLAQSNATDMAEWLPESFRSYLVSTGVAGEQYMSFLEYSHFRDTYLFGVARTQTGNPLWITYGPDHTLSVWPLPDGIYIIGGEYYRSPTTLALNADDPAAVGNGLPAKFHMLLVYKAMKSYAAFEAAPEVYERALAGEKREMNSLIAWGLPMVSMGGAIA